jgi:uncharacterized membrane protein YeiH
LTTEKPAAATARDRIRANVHPPDQHGLEVDDRARISVGKLLGGAERVIATQVAPGKILLEAAVVVRAIVPAALSPCAPSRCARRFPTVRPVVRAAEPLLVVDALGLALFGAAGTRKALDTGLSGIASIGIGVITAVGGGLLRDVLLREIPRTLRPSEPYGLAAMAAAIVVVAADGAELPQSVFCCRRCVGIHHSHGLGPQTVTYRFGHRRVAPPGLATSAAFGPT